MTTLRQFLGSPVPGFPFFKHTQHTLLIDLSQDDETLLSAMGKNTRAQLRKAETDGFWWSQTDDLEGFADAFNTFATEKGLPLLSLDVLEAEREFLFVASTGLIDKPLVSHAYLIDREESRARFLYGTTVRLSDEIDANLVGRANRLAHFREMQEFRKQGIRTFDFGGFSLNTKDAQKQGINQFKESFGGTVVEECTFDSIWLAAGKLVLGQS